MFTTNTYPVARIAARVRFHDDRANDFADAAIRASRRGEHEHADELAAANLQAFGYAVALESEHGLTVHP